MTSEPSTLVILGASGDLTERLLLPGLGSLVASDRGRRIQLIGTGRSERGADEWRKTVKTAFDSVDAKGRRAAGIVSSTKYIQADPTDLDDLKRILDACEGAPALYFALPPAISIEVCEQLEKVDLPEGTTLALEKPFGSNSRTAAQLNRQLLKLVPEERIHRTDHFLGLSTVLNLVSLRFANRFFESVWSAKDIEKVEILYDEQLALEG
ncbi:glucose-6-phosphate dehydrogenase, partial [Clavibacter sp. DM3]|nr:glucose-6-phosphate dehydrogenase [Clavibacter zhangzhiyongii]